MNEWLTIVEVSQLLLDLKERWSTLSRVEPTFNFGQSESERREETSQTQVGGGLFGDAFVLCVGTCKTLPAPKLQLVNTQAGFQNKSTRCVDNTE